MERVIKTIIERSAGRDICIYGAGETGETMRSMLKAEGMDIAFFIDKKWRHLNGSRHLPVYSADFLDCEKHFVVLNVSNNMAATDSIKETLVQLGYGQGEWFHWYDDVDYDVVINGVSIGKCTTVVDLFLEPKASKKLASIGRFVSLPMRGLRINPSHFFGLSSSYLVSNEDIRRRKYTVSSPIEIGHDVYIGENVFIDQSKVKKIGNGAIIGVGSVILENVPPYAVVVGVPGKVKKYRFSPEQIDLLERVCWWNWDDETMKANSDCFVNPNLFFERFGKI